MQNGKVFPGILLALVLASGASWWYWSHSKAATEPNAESPRGQGSGKARGGFGNGDNRPVAVLAASVKTGDIRIVQTALGTVTPSAVVTVSSRVNGQLTRILFKEGQLVRAGELLAEIDPRPFQATLSQVQGQALRNQALLRNSQIDLERYKTLQAQDSIAVQQVDAQASLVQQYQGTVQSDQGVVDNAKLQLSFTRITSPISGRIGLRQVDMGNNITTTNALAVVNTVDPIHVVFTLPEDRVSDLVNRFQAAKKSGKGLPVEAWDRGNTNLLAKGSLLSLDNQIDTTSGTVKLKAQFTNEGSTLFPNQFVNVRLLSNTLRDVTVVPNAAIQRGSAGTFVYKITRGKKDASKVAPNDAQKNAPRDFQKDTASNVPKGVPAEGLKKESGRKGNGGKTETVTVQVVRLGSVDGDNVEVLDGLKPGDQVVISGIDKLKENAKVIVTRPDGNSGKGGRRGNRQDGASDSGSELKKTNSSESASNIATASGSSNRPNKLSGNASALDGTRDGATPNRRQRTDVTGSDESKSIDAATEASFDATSADVAQPRKRGDWAAKTDAENLGDGTRQRPEGGWKRRNADQSASQPNSPANVAK